MQGLDWVRICTEVFGLGGDLEVIAVGEPPNAAIAPLFRARQHGHRLEMIGANQLYEVTDFLYSDQSDTAALATAIVGSRLPVRLERIPADSPIPRALAKAYRGRGIVVTRPTIGCPWIPLDQPWSDPEQRLNGHRRQNLRRSRRIAEKMGPVSCDILSPSAKDLESVLREAYAVEATGWKGQESSALAKDALSGEFYRRYAAFTCQQGTLRVCFLRIGTRAAAMQIAAESGGRFWLLKIGYSQEFARCSPGTLLLAETIRYAARAGLRSYEFLGVDEPWIRDWNPLVRPCVSLRVYPIGLRGGLAIIRDFAAMTPSEAKAIFRLKR